MKRRIKMAQIGIGHNHGSEKMRTALNFPDVFEVVGVCERNPAWIASRGSLDVYQGLPFISEEELLNVPGLDAVMVETDVWDLIPTAQRCIDHGLHLHIDKPAGDDIAEFEKLLSDAKCQNLVVQLAYMYRYNNAVQYAHDMATSGALGEIFEIDAVMSTEHSRRLTLNSAVTGLRLRLACLTTLSTPGLKEPELIQAVCRIVM